MYLQKVIGRKNCVKNQFFAAILKVNDENSRIRIHQSEAWNRGSGSGSTPKCHGSGTLLKSLYKYEKRLFYVPYFDVLLPISVGHQIGYLQCLKPDRNHTEIEKDKFSLRKIFEYNKFFAQMYLKFTLCKISKMTNSVAVPGCLSPITDPDYLPGSTRTKRVERQY